jgi:anthranilate phosphoribosyltransferase
MKHAIGPRRELGQRTIFNLLGPLTNPAGATHQLIGVYDPALTQTLAEVLASLGGRAAFVVHGYGGLDELSTSGPNRVSHLKDGACPPMRWTPPAWACARLQRGAAAASRPRKREMLRDLSGGRRTAPRRDVVLLNARRRWRWSGRLPWRAGSRCPLA